MEENVTNHISFQHCIWSVVCTYNVVKASANDHKNAFLCSIMQLFSVNMATTRSWSWTCWLDRPRWCEVCNLSKVFSCDQGFREDYETGHGSAKASLCRLGLDGCKLIQRRLSAGLWGEDSSQIRRKSRAKKVKDLQNTLLSSPVCTCTHLGGCRIMLQCKPVHVMRGQKRGFNIDRLSSRFS